MKETDHSKWVSEFNKEINKLYSVHTNSASVPLEYTVAFTSTKANEEDISRGGDEDDVEDGNSSSKGLQKRDSNEENDVVLEVVSVEDEIFFSGMKYIIVS